MNATPDTTLLAFLIEKLGAGTVHAASTEEVLALPLPEGYAVDPMHETLLADMQPTPFDVMVRHVIDFHQLSTPGCALQVFWYEGNPPTKMVKYTPLGLTPGATTIVQLDPAGTKFYIR